MRGLNRCGGGALLLFRWPLHEIAAHGQRAVCAIRLLGMAHAAAVINQPMVRPRPILFRHRAVQPRLHLGGRIPLRQPQAVADAEHVGVHGDGVPAESDGIHDVRRLFPDAREAHQLLHGAGDLAAEAFENVAAGGQNMHRLRLVQAAGKDVFLQFLLREPAHGGGGRVLLKQLFRHLVHPLVRCIARRG